MLPQGLQIEKGPDGVFKLYQGGAAWFLLEVEILVIQPVDSVLNLLYKALLVSICSLNAKPICDTHLLDNIWESYINAPRQNPELAETISLSINKSIFHPIIGCEVLPRQEHVNQVSHETNIIDVVHVS